MAITVVVNKGTIGSSITSVQLLESETENGTYTAISGQTNVLVSAFPVTVTNVDDDSKFIKILAIGSCTTEQKLTITGIPVATNAFINSSPTGVIAFGAGTRVGGLRIQGNGGIFEFRVNGSTGSWSQTISVDETDLGTAYNWRCRQTTSSELVDLGLTITQQGGLDIQVDYQTPSDHTGIVNTSTAFKYYLNVCSGQFSGPIVMKLDQTKYNFPTLGPCDGLNDTGNTYKIAPDSYIIIELA